MIHKIAHTYIRHRIFIVFTIFLTFIGVGIGVYEKYALNYYSIKNSNYTFNPDMTSVPEIGCFVVIMVPFSIALFFEILKRTHTLHIKKIFYEII